GSRRVPLPPARIKVRTSFTMNQSAPGHVARGSVVVRSSSRFRKPLAPVGVRGWAEKTPSPPTPLPHRGEGSLVERILSSSKKRQTAQSLYKPTKRRTRAAAVPSGLGQYGHIGQVPILVIEVETVADDEDVGNVEAAVIRLQR